MPKVINEAWYDFFKVFNLAFKKDPLSNKDGSGFSGAGTSQDGAMPDLRANDGGGGSVQLRDTREFVDFSTITNRMHRYKEYERLRGMAEIEMALTVFADEACVAGDTLISTLAHGLKSIEWLTENMPNERFLVYCWDFNKQDFTIGWAFAPRVTKESETVRIIFDDGTALTCTRDHRILKPDEQWIEAGKLRAGDTVQAFHRVEAKQSLTECRVHQFPRILTHSKGWIHERQFIDEWRSGKSLSEYDKINELCRMTVGGLTTPQIHEKTGHDPVTIRKMFERAGWSQKELNWLKKKSETRRIINVIPWDKIKVYDLTVEDHHNFCTDSTVVHNCQRDENGRVFQIVTGNEDIKEELEFLMFHRKMLNLDQKKMWNRAKNLFLNGDDFMEVIINEENPKEGIKGINPLPADSMFRIETTKGRLVEFQQSKEGPDYQSLARVDVTQATDADLQQSTAVRFAPEQVIHIRIGDDRKTFYPYGVSLVEAARGPAHQLRLMEDSMVVYRLERAPERRIFYIDVMQLTGARAEALVERMKDQFKKKKVSRSGLAGASSVEERWHAPSAGEDIWVPTRTNSNTRIETLPGAQNLGEIDDTVYFRNKLFTALNFPKNYFNNEDVQATRVSLSAQDVKFARMIERLQSHIEDGLWEICDRHLRLRGYPEELYEDLEIKMTPPSDWRELTRSEVVSARIQNAGSIKGAQFMADYDILTLWMKYSEDETKKMLARNKIQKLEELKMQIIAQNPRLLGTGVPGQDDEEVSTDPSEENPMLGGAGEDEQPPPDAGGGEGEAPPDMSKPPMKPGGGNSGKGMPGMAVPTPSDEDVRKYNLQIKDYSFDQDREEHDFSETC